MRLFRRQVDYPLTRPLRVGHVTLHERSVIELRLEHPDGAVAYGEVAPLPGLHREPLDVLPTLLPWALRRIQQCHHMGSLRVEMVADHDRWRALPPSLRCGLEAAVLTCHGSPWLPEILYGLPTNPVPPPCGLVDRDLADLDPSLAAHCCLKIKVGRRAMHTEIAMVHALRRVLGEGPELRLDANRAFSLEDALDFAAEVATAEPVWIEEPLGDPDELPEFIRRAAMCVALDETLHEPEHARLAFLEGVRAWVIKPALLGVLDTVELFGRALTAPNRPVCLVSSSFEGRRGLDFLKLLACHAPGCPAPGLGTAGWLGPASCEPWEEVHATS